MEITEKIDNVLEGNDWDDFTKGVEKEIKAKKKFAKENKDKIAIDSFVKSIRDITKIYKKNKGFDAELNLLARAISTAKERKKNLKKEG